MPKYEYWCRPCKRGEEMSRTVELRDAHTICQVCGGPMFRVFTVPGVTFKGSGFYSTDNKTT